MSPGPCCGAMGWSPGACWSAKPTGCRRGASCCACKYWYDFELKDEHRLLYDIDDHNRKEGAKSSGAQLLDAFLYHNYSIGDLPGSVRVGKQVVSWGESTFIQNSINSINPMDVAAFRRPGAEIKEGLIPVNMLYLSQGLGGGGVDHHHDRWRDEDAEGAGVADDPSAERLWITRADHAGDGDRTHCRHRCRRRAG